MTPERWRQITGVFYAAKGRDAAGRAAFLDEACAGDPSLRSEVEQMRKDLAALETRFAVNVNEARAPLDFTAAELVRGFTDLVAWVEGGVHPAGDDVLTPPVVAAPTYGCQFTTATRNLGPFTARCP